MPRKSIKTKSETKTKSLEAPVYNPEGNLVGRAKLPDWIFNREDNPAIIAQAVRVYSSNQRAGTASSKTRSEVSGSTRKIYRQKGTGRARHGDIKAPIFIGGGIAHGPKPREYTLNFPQKMKRLALFTALSSTFKTERIKILTGWEKILPKTKIMVQLIQKIYNLSKNKKIFPKLLLVTGTGAHNLYLASRNLPYLSIRQANLLNTYDVMSHSQILFLKEAVGKLTEVWPQLSASKPLSDMTLKSPPKKEKKLVLIAKPEKRITPIQTKKLIKITNPQKKPKKVTVKTRGRIKHG